MRILAIDPGTTESAYVIMSDMTIITAAIVSNDIMLTLVKNAGHLNAMAIEMIEGLGMPVGKETFETVWWIGRFCEASPVPFHRVYRKDVKLHLCGNHRAKDANIRQALLDKLGPQGKKRSRGPTYGVKSHQWAALAVGVTFIESGHR